LTYRKLLPTSISSPKTSSNNFSSPATQP